jgi:hypothetical protein
MEALSKADLRKVRNYLTKVYPGVAEQDDLWNLIQRIDKILKAERRVKRG